MTSREIRQAFVDFFESKEHEIVPSAPIVLKDDPTLMFTNAGMNQFKDFFLENRMPTYPRVADTQKCLRVSGKHNDIEEVGRDSYHHTMFEMLGNWSFGDYFKKEAIAYAWELLTEVYGIDKDCLYVTVFEGDERENLAMDTEARELWKQYVPEERILWGSKKDNFWEMGDTGPCGPCTEIHVDIRSEAEQLDTPGASLVNQDHPLVVEIWNLVFIQFNRRADQSLELLKKQHVDTGMGFERLVMAIQHKKSSYDTDVFAPYIQFIEEFSDLSYGGRYGEGAEVDSAMRVVADHIRAVAFCIADGTLPSNTGAGYVIRRILRRAVRFYYSSLHITQPFMYKLMPIMVEYMGDVFPEIEKQEDFIAKVIKEEEQAFLQTLEEGLKRIEKMQLKDGEVISGCDAFMLYDTYGFPIDLTQLIASDYGCSVDIKGFGEYMENQKIRSKQDAEKQEGDWQIVSEDEVEFVGYDLDSADNTRIVKYRKVRSKKKSYYQLVLNKTPFYPEGGGQIGDTGYLIQGDEKVKVLNTVKENNLIIHQVSAIPFNENEPLFANIDKKRRLLIENNHTATHLLHAALRSILGNHIHQKGSLVTDKYLRFDFAYYQKLSDEELHDIEKLVNSKIRENIVKKEQRNVPIEEAKEEGAIMLFGEKYGEKVRMITFDDTYSKELCGGCHVSVTGNIGLFKIISESSVASGVRRIEAITSEAAELYIDEELETLQQIRSMLKNPTDIVNQLQKLIDDNKHIEKELNAYRGEQATHLKNRLLERFFLVGDVQVLAETIELEDSKQLKDITFQLMDVIESGIIILGADVQGKPMLNVAISKELTHSDGLHAGNLIRQASALIKGGGGGQPFFASAGGSDLHGLEKAVLWIKEKVEESIK